MNIIYAGSDTLRFASVLSHSATGGYTHCVSPSPEIWKHGEKRRLQHKFAYPPYMPGILSFVKGKKNETIASSASIPTKIFCDM